MLGYYPWSRPGGAVIIWCIVPAAITALCLTSPLGLIGLVLLTPFLATISGSRGGLLALAAGVIIPLAAIIPQQIPDEMFLAASIYMLVPSITGAACFIRKAPFWHGLVIQLGAFAIGIIGAFLLIQPLYGPNLLETMGLGVANFIGGQENGDAMLIQLNQLGLCAVSLQDLGLPSLGLGSILYPLVKAELIASLATSIENIIYVQGSGWLVNWVLAGGLITICAPICYHKRKGWDTLDMPVFARWHMPRSMGGKVMVLYLGGMLPYIAYSPVTVIMGNMMCAVSTGMLIVQGAATLEFLQKKKGTPSSQRRLWIGGLGLFLSFTLVLLGVWDQIANIRGLRAPKKKEDIE